jgi:hypothetical protein
MSSRLTTVLTLLIYCTVIYACNGGSQATTVSITTRPQSVAAGAQMPFSATFTQNSQTQSLGIGWELAPYTGAVGTLSQPASTGSNISTVTYTAPATPPTPNSVTIIAYSISNRNALDSVTFTITGSALPSIQTTALPAGTVGMAYPSTTLLAIGGTAPYTWNITSGLLPTGMTFSGGALSGTPGSAGTFPITFQVTDSNNSSVQAILMLTVSFPTSGTCGSPLGSEAELSGQYAFLLRGFDNNGPTAIVGSFTADGTGQITGGQEDVNTNGGFSSSNESFISSSSNFTLDSYNRGCLTVTTTLGTFEYRFSAVLDNSGSADHGYLISFDSSGARVSGTFQKQDATAFSVNQISGNYAFGVASTLSKGRYAAVGSFAASAGVLSAGAIDMNITGNVDGGGLPVTGAPTVYPTTPIPFTGTYTVASSGRGTLVLTLQDQSINGVFYVVSASQLYLIRSDPQSSSVTPLFAGRVLQQSGAPYSNASLSGTDVRYFGATSTSGTGAKESLGLLTITAPGSFSYSDNYNDGNNVNSDSGSGSYTVDPSSGRVNLSADLSFAPVCYLSAPNQAFCIGTDTLTSSGEILPQTAGPFESSSISGDFVLGTMQHPSLNGNLQSGASAITSSGNLTTLTDQNAMGSILTLGTVNYFTYYVIYNGTGALQPLVGSGNNILYVVSPQLWLAVDGVGTDPTLTFYEQ